MVSSLCLAPNFSRKGPEESAYRCDVHLDAMGAVAVSWQFSSMKSIIYLKPWNSQGTSIKNQLFCSIKLLVKMKKQSCHYYPHVFSKWVTPGPQKMDDWGSMHSKLVPKACCWAINHLLLKYVYDTSLVLYLVCKIPILILYLPKKLQSISFFSWNLHDHHKQRPKERCVFSIPKVVRVREALKGPRQVPSSLTGHGGAEAWLKKMGWISVVKRIWYLEDHPS